MCLWKARKWTVVLITLIDGNSSSPKKISLDNHYTLDFPLLRIFVLFFFCVIPLVARAAVTHFPSARARAYTHILHTHARAGARERAHTHMHTHATHASSSSSTPFSSRLLHLSSSSRANNMRNNVTNPFFVFFFSFYQVCDYMNILNNQLIPSAI